MELANFPADTLLAICQNITEGDAALAAYEVRSDAIDLPRACPVMPHAANLILHMTGAPAPEKIAADFLTPIRAELLHRGVPGAVAEHWLGRIIRVAGLGVERLRQANGGQTGTA